MIVTTSPAPVTPTSTTPGSIDAPTTAAVFSALVTQALGDVRAPAVPGAPAVPCTTVDVPAAEAMPTVVEPVGVEPVVVPAVDGAVQLVRPLLGAVPAAVPGPLATTVRESTTTEDEDAPVDIPAETATSLVRPDVPVGVVPPVVAAPADPSQTTSTPAPAAVQDVPGDPTTAVVPPDLDGAVRPSTLAAGSPPPDPVANAAPADQPMQPAAAPVERVPGVSAAVDPSAILAPTPSVPGARGEDTAPAAVRAQVFPEVTRLVTTGPGTHRVTLQLNPGELGEVRVVLTVRRGVVRVSLAASPLAQVALADGAPELRRLLELGGASDSRVVVRDLPAAAPSGPGTPDRGPDASGQSGSGQVGGQPSRSHDQHAGTRGGSTSAMDGDVGKAIPPPIDPTTRPRTSGVDVTI